MKSRYKADFDELPWEHVMEGVRHKLSVRDGVRLRVVEYGKTMPPHWCEKGHFGFVIDGRMEIEYDGERVVYGPGDGVYIPDGPAHRHRARVLSEKAVVFFVEES
jgi:quercetin dioxygenase-like cupin family protein